MTAYNEKVMFNECAVRLRTLKLEFYRLHDNHQKCLEVQEEYMRLIVSNITDQIDRIEKEMKELGKSEE